jgi:hypothetical protein
MSDQNKEQTMTTPDPFGNVLKGHANWLANHPNNPVDNIDRWNARVNFECGRGWAGMLERLFDELARIVRPTGDVITVSQIKEKYGTLRVYWHGAVNAETDHLIDGATLLAEFRSEVTCQLCGEPGLMRENGFGLYHLACDEHSKHDDRIVARKIIGQLCAQLSTETYEEKSIIRSGIAY